MLKLVTRAQWGARKPRRRTVKELNRASTCHWHGNVVLVFGQKEWDHKYCASVVRGIQNFHMDSNDWVDIAYNFLECPHGYTYEGRGLDVINAANGTNTANQNSHAICAMSGVGNPFKMEEKVGFKAAVAYIAERTGAPNQCVGHRDHKSTQCPGDERYAWVHAGMPIESVFPPLPPQGGDDEMKPRIVRNTATGECFAWNGMYLVRANDPDHQAIVRFYAGQAEPWDNWDPKFIAAVPIMDLPGAE